MCLTYWRLFPPIACDVHSHTSPLRSSLRRWVRMPWCECAFEVVLHSSEAAVVYRRSLYYCADCMSQNWRHPLFTPLNHLVNLFPFTRSHMHSASAPSASYVRLMYSEEYDLVRGFNDFIKVIKYRALLVYFAIQLSRRRILGPEPRCSSRVGR